MLGTSSFVIWGVVAALGKACLFLNLQPDPSLWKPINEIQKKIISNYFVKYNELGKFSKEELRSWASRNAEELNKILKEEGFDFRFDPFDPLKREFGVLSILDVLVTWKEKAEKGTLISAIDKKEYPAVLMGKNFEVYETSSYPHPLLKIEAKSGDYVWITIADKALPDFELFEHVRKITQEKPKLDSSYTKTRFPMVDMQQKIELDWLVGMQLYEKVSVEEEPIQWWNVMAWIKSLWKWIQSWWDSEKEAKKLEEELEFYYIKKAIQENIFKMNETGAHVKSATALVVEIMAPAPRTEKELLIDKPFYLWIERPNLSEPIFVGYITEPNWKDPGTLEIPASQKE